MNISDYRRYFKWSKSVILYSYCINNDFDKHLNSHDIQKREDQTTATGDTIVWMRYVHCECAFIEDHTLRDSLVEHTQLLLGSGSPERLDKAIQNYKNCLRVIFDEHIVVQTSKTPQHKPLVSLTPNYLCLQCSACTTEAGRIEHGQETSHRFCLQTFTAQQLHG